MPPPLLRQGTDHALEQSCRDAEALVSRVAKLVLHASALAARTEALPRTADPRAAQQRSARVRALHDAAEAGRLSLRRVASLPCPAPDVDAGRRPGGAPARDGQPPVPVPRSR